VNRFLYGVDTADELSLSTTACRASFEFDRFFARFQQDLQGLLYADIDRDRFAHVAYDENGTSRFVDPEINARYLKWRGAFQRMVWDVFVSGLAQHYGIPTDGLDLTDSIDVAVWMALMEQQSDIVGDRICAQYRVRPISDSLPVIYLLLTEDPPPGSLSDVGKDFVSLHSTRQQRQRAHLHFGGWGLHTNLCAEEALAAVFLSHKVQVNLAEPQFIFPNSKDDPFFARLLELRDRRLVWGWRNVVEYAFD
jgi:hypothetical protein